MDIDAIRKRLNQLQTTNQRSNNLWKPQPGKQVVRIVPFKYNKSTPFIELYFHYDLGGRTYISPISFGRPDPVEEFADKLKSSGNRDDWRLGKKLEAKMRTFAPVIVRGAENDGVKFWGFGKTVYQELLSIITDPDYGDIADAVSGRDVVVEFKTAEETGKSFPTTAIRVKPNQTPISEDSKLMESALDNQVNLNEVYNELSYDDLTNVLNEWLNPSTEGEGNTDKSTNGEMKKEETVETTAKETLKQTTTVEDTSSAFDELFNR
jgi:hypothetical protein